MILEFIVRKSINKKIQTPQDLARQKREGALRFKQKMPTNIQLLKVYHDLLKKRKVARSPQLEKILKTREIRTLSGVAVVTVLTKPFACPGRCLYCPDEPDMPKSYLKNEPAAQRAYLNKFDPYKQVETRLQALAMTGHDTDKIELIVLGGTWSAYPNAYKHWFIKECFKATNSKQLTVNRKQQPINLNWSKNLQRMRAELKYEQHKNETAQHRIVGLTLETRPDFISIEEIKKMRDLGCTRVELGVQSIYDNVLKKNLRGHTIRQTIQATKLLRDAGFKINYHMMLNLPGSDAKRDKKMFSKLFSSPDLQPDLLKIYPCVVLKTAPLYKLWKNEKYKPYTEKQLINLIMTIKKKIPAYVRIQRIIRDIPKQSIVAGTKISNLRQLIESSGRKICRCIRCREIKSRALPQKIKLFRQDYAAAGGKEIFLSFEDKKQKNLYAFLRLRLPQKSSSFLPVLRDAALIREIHTFGRLAPLSKTCQQAKEQFMQHKGLGKRLMAQAERIVRTETRFTKIAVISGVGARQYYRLLGYRLQDEYMVKNTVYNIHKH
ncbi:MAG: tRNA uridine(34) 5-carboxymethylaminomethyl modification radical SAM/GNAT enzyme Elp3 [bacterium]